VLDGVAAPIRCPYSGPMVDKTASHMVNLFDRYVSALNTRQRAQALEIVAAELDHNGERMTSAHWWDHHIAANLKALPDYTWTVDEMITCGDRVIVRYTDSGTLTQPWVGLTNIGAPIQFREYVIYTVHSNLIIEVWSVFDHWALVEHDSH